jgi:hypothetical protein
MPLRGVAVVVGLGVSTTGSGIFVSKSMILTNSTSSMMQVQFSVKISNSFFSMRMSMVALDVDGLSKTSGVNVNDFIVGFYDVKVTT